MNKLPWKEASTIILTGLKPKSESYKLLFLKRSSKSKFMPNALVFPGGTVDKYDSSSNWSQLFKKFDIDEHHFESLNCFSGSCPPMFQSKTSDEDVHKSVSLRITAIRETFEEVGILLCKKDVNELNKAAAHLDIPDLQNWRTKVQKSPEHFLDLCNKFNCFPDIWNLSLWSNWLTPRNFPKIRFDTAFFLVSLQNTPVPIADNTEVSEAKWLDLNEVLELFSNKEVWLAPPQYYETLRLKEFHTLSELSAFARKRNSEGCERWMPVVVQTTDGEVSLLPGDSSYPKDIDFSPGKAEKVDMTSSQFQSGNRILHRLENSVKGDCKVVISNYKEKLYPGTRSCL